MGVIDGPVPCTCRAKGHSSSDLIRLCTEIEFLKTLPQGGAMMTAWLSISGITLVGYGLGCMYWPLAPIWFGVWLLAIAGGVAKQRKQKATDLALASMAAKRNQSDDQPHVN